MDGVPVRITRPASALGNKHLFVDHPMHGTAQLAPNRRRGLAPHLSERHRPAVITDDIQHRTLHLARAARHWGTSSKCSLRTLRDAGPRFQAGLSRGSRAAVLLE